jgi:3-oxoadipate CoA-transferase alpha subunit
MIQKVFASPAEAVADVGDNAVLMVGGFVAAGSPAHLIAAVRDRGPRNITIISNNCGFGDTLDTLVEKRLVGKLVASFPVHGSAERVTNFERQFRAGEVQLELVPQGTLAERIRAGGAGIGAFYTPTGVGTITAEGKEVREIDGRPHLLEYPLKADFALIKARVTDRMGNLLYHGAARNFNPIMAMAARTTIVEVAELVETGDLDPEQIVTPGIFVDRIVVVGG